MARDVAYSTSPSFPSDAMIGIVVGMDGKEYIDPVIGLWTTIVRTDVSGLSVSDIISIDASLIKLPL